MALLVEFASWVCLVAGGFFCIVGTIGLNRMPDFFTRMHAASVTDTLGAGINVPIRTVVFLGLLMFVASPAAAHALAKAALARGLKPRLHEEDPSSKRS